MHTAKYSRTYHYPFSPGATNDDRINNDYWRDLKNINTFIHTEKMDGENNCLNRWGVFARSHAAPSVSPWTADLRTRWQLIKRDLGSLEIFLENLYAVHSIEYRALDSHYYVFAVRDAATWLSWEEVCFYAAMIDMPTVPVIETGRAPSQEPEFRQSIEDITKGPGMLSPFDVRDKQPCSMEGIVTRNIDAFSTDNFQHNVFKWVRRGHVKTDEHWTRNWKRAKLKWEGGSHVDTY